MAENDLYVSAFELIKKSNNILLVTHYHPDGDGLSSVCALAELLESLKKTYTPYCIDTPPSCFNYLPHIDEFISDKNLLDFKSFDLFITVDCGSLSRTKLEHEIGGRSAQQAAIEFDHHPKIDNYADVEIKKPKASSTAEIIYHFFRANSLQINKNIANCILTGLITDTNNFLYPSTSDKTVKIASEMLLKGARFPLIMENTWRNKSLAAMKLWGRAIDNLEINKKYNFAYSILDEDILTESQATDEELEGIAGFLSNLYGVSGLVFLRQENGDLIKGSLRTSTPGLNISPLAQFLGGGGHAKASGFSIAGKLEQTDEGWRIV